MSDRQIVAKFCKAPDRSKPLPPDERRKHLELAARAMKSSNGLMADGSTPEAWVEMMLNGKGRKRGEKRRV